MIRSTGIDKFDDNLRGLRRALVGLSGTEDRPVARRNARVRVLKELRKVRSTLDTLFPSIVVHKKRARKAPVDVILMRMQRKGLVNVGSHSLVARYAAAGVKVHKVGDWLLLPNWAVAIPPGDTARIKAALKSSTVRKAVLAIAALTRSKPQNGAV
jgi:hypothetical protein